MVIFSLYFSCIFAKSSPREFSRGYSATPFRSSPLGNQRSFAVLGDHHLKTFRKNTRWDSNIPIDIKKFNRHFLMEKFPQERGNKLCEIHCFFLYSEFRQESIVTRHINNFEILSNLHFFLSFKVRAVIFPRFQKFIQIFPR